LKRIARKIQTLKRQIDSSVAHLSVTFIHNLIFYQKTPTGVFYIQDTFQVKIKTYGYFIPHIFHQKNLFIRKSHHNPELFRRLCSYCRYRDNKVVFGRCGFLMFERFHLLIPCIIVLEILNRCSIFQVILASLPNHRAILF